MQSMTARRYCFIFVEYCSKKAMSYKMQRGKWTALKTATKQTWPGCFCGRFSDKEMLLAMNFGGRSTLQGKIEAIWTISFKIRAKIEVREHLYCVSLRVCVCRLCRPYVLQMRWNAFKFSFLPSTPCLFYWKLSLNSRYGSTGFKRCLK